MSCVGKELNEDAARFPIVDSVEGHDLVTNSSVLKVGTAHFPHNIFFSCKT